MGDAIATSLYDVPISPRDTREIIDEASKAADTPLLTAIVFTTRRTIARHGYANRTTQTVYLNPLGHDLGTALHELAHITAPPWSGHNKAYKAVHTLLVQHFEQLLGIRPQP